MSMQEFEQEAQESQGQSGYQVSYPGSYEIEQQKIHPSGGQRAGYAFPIWTIVLSSIGFFCAVGGIVASAITLGFAQGQQALYAAGGLGMASSILVMFICIALFVIAIVALARAIARRRGAGRSFSRRRNLGI